MSENETPKYEGVRCPDCGSEDWEKKAEVWTAGGFAAFCWAFFFMSLWIPIIGWIAAPLLLLGGIVSTGVWLFGAKPTPVVFAACKRCHKRIELEDQPPQAA